LMLLPSTWWAAVAVPQRKLAGKVKRSVAIADVPQQRKTKYFRRYSENGAFANGCI
jgi:hypothetical protein